NSFKINTPENATVSVSVAGSVAADTCYNIQIGSSSDYLDGCLTVIGAPAITAVDGTNVTGSPGGLPYVNENGAKDTLVITGTGFTTTSVVSASSNIGTFGTAVASGCTTQYFGPYDAFSYDLCTTLTVPVTWISFTGATPVIGDLTVTNPTGFGSATASSEIALFPAPTVTGTYYVPTFSTNIEYPVTGTGFLPGLTATSSNSAYSVTVANVTPTVVTLLVTTTSAATSGTSSTITFTDPLGGSVKWQLNGGPAPLPPLKVSATFGRPAHRGKSTVFQLNGQNLENASVSANHKGISVTILSDSNTSLRVRVTVSKTEKGSVAKLHITNTNGSAYVAFSIKK
ncbi:MAG TPA: hypothetical protein VGS61_06300, partial [Acidimicrobiales bacterium]|nr:hypothetical protein [Acidimicrobiales bacterium]